jgi:hypothetical protein
MVPSGHVAGSIMDFSRSIPINHLSIMQRNFIFDNTARANGRLWRSAAYSPLSAKRFSTR